MTPTTSTRRGFLKGTVILAAGSVLAACGGSASPSAPAASSLAASPASAASPSAQPPTLTKATILEGGRVISWGAAYVAIDQGFFRDEGIDIDYQTAGAGTATAAVTAVINGAALFSFTGSPTSVSAIAKGAALRIVEVVGSEYSAELTASNAFLKAKNVSPTSTLEQKIQALKGAKLAINSPGDSLDQLIHVLFKLYGLNADKDALLIPTNSTPNQLAAFQQGTVDLMVASPPGGEQAEAKGLGKVFLRPKEVPAIRGYPYSVATGSLKDIKERPQVVKGAVKAMAKAGFLITSQSDAAKASVRKYLSSFEQDVFDITYSTFAAGAFNPVPSEEAFNNLAKFQEALGTPMTLKFADVMSPDLVAEAVKELGH